MKNSSSISSFSTSSQKSDENERKIFILEKSENKHFLWKISFQGIYDVKIIYFGNPKMKNFTMNRCAKERLTYIKSHETFWESEDFETREFWERWLLYNKSSIEKSVEDTEKRFHIKIQQKEKKKGFTLPKTFQTFMDAERNADQRLVKKIISV